MHFVKVHGAGNDFILLPDLNDTLELHPGLVQRLCAPHLGLGADGVIRLAPARSGVDADVFMDYWNADGSIAEMCGNGVRCVAKYVADRGLVTSDTVRVDTRGGVKAVEIITRGAGDLVERVRVDMGAPVVGKVDWPLDVNGETLNVTTLSMGNPHAVIEVDEVADEDLEPLGRRLQEHEAFPDGTNVELITVDDRSVVRGRIWERGVGETMASGTGASAMAAAAHLLGLADRETRVVLPGGALDVEWTETTLQITGPAAEVASGELDEAWLTTIR
ncbi:MAG: diaminopimelate epimerase [Nitriliruptorales bacterium]|nr:diaminopimelate epimerase [Nitriliruptorales bacterium]